MLRTFQETVLPEGRSAASVLIHLVYPGCEIMLCRLYICSTCMCFLSTGLLPVLCLGIVLASLLLVPLLIVFLKKPKRAAPTTENQPKTSVWFILLQFVYLFFFIPHFLLFHKRCFQMKYSLLSFFKPSAHDPVSLVPLPVVPVDLCDIHVELVEDHISIGPSTSLPSRHVWQMETGTKRLRAIPPRVLLCRCNASLCSEVSKGEGVRLVHLCKCDLLSPLKRSGWNLSLHWKQNWTAAQR